MGPKAVRDDARSSEGVLAQTEEYRSGNRRLQVRRGVQAGVLPLPVDREAVYGKSSPVQRGREGADVLRPSGELVSAAADLLRGAGGPESSR